MLCLEKSQRGRRRTVFWVTVGCQSQESLCLCSLSFLLFFFPLSLQPRNWNRPWSLVILNIQHLSLSAPSRKPQGTLLVKTAPSKPPASFLLSVELPMCLRAHDHSERWNHGGPLVWGGVSPGLEKTSLGFVRSFRTWERFKMLENVS